MNKEMPLISKRPPVASKISAGALKGLFKLVLNEDSLLRIDGDHRGSTISCVKGAVCITQQNDSTDHILSGNEIFSINRQGRVIIWAVFAAAIEIDFPEAGKPCLTGQLRRIISLGGK